ncbi:hypothetical protein [Sphingosinicella sp.]|uniref:hypothetical protein n=1 Tax=Sphingosinicella sp. TaxID=1917971 RepID=UPI0040384031
MSEDRIAGRTADWLSLAATPAFALMALLASAQGGAADLLCGAAGGFSPGGMVTMYLLMSVFHVAPWLRLISSR